MVPWSRGIPSPPLERCRLGCLGGGSAASAPDPSRTRPAGAPDADDGGSRWCWREWRWQFEWYDGGGVDAAGIVYICSGQILCMVSKLPTKRVLVFFVGFFWKQISQTGTSRKT